MLKRIARSLYRKLVFREGERERLIVSQSLMHARENRRCNVVTTLADVEFHGLSQWGEDGIVDWLISKLPSIPRTFVEFGVEDYREANTRLLLWLRNWRGLVIDGSSANVRDILRQDISWRFDLQAVAALVDRDNINSLIRTSGFSGEIGLLSIDIDGNDYWIWDAIQVIQPAIVVCEYNGILGDLKAITVPYDSRFQRTRAHSSNLYFGSSIRALIELGNRKGYAFAGTNSNGVNAFFIRRDYAPQVLEAISDKRAYPPLFRESIGNTGIRTYLGGLARFDLIAHLPVFNCETETLIPLREVGEIYSPQWRMSLGTSYGRNLGIGEETE